jgi:hypothetical protein
MSRPRSTPRLPTGSTPPPETVAIGPWAFYEAEARLPASGQSRREPTLAGWLIQRRKLAVAGALSPVYAQDLDTFPNRRDHRRSGTPTQPGGSSD